MVDKSTTLPPSFVLFSSSTKNIMSPLLSFSGSALSLSSCVLFGSVAAVLYLSYRAILPRPIPGIPYNKNAVKSVLGDMPSMARHHGTTQEVFTWMTQQCVDLNSPVIQLFLHPFGRPVVFIVDFRESMDILLRRTKEFDRSNFFGDLFVGLLPAHHISMPTNATFKHQRRLLADTMSSAFLADVRHVRLAVVQVALTTNRQQHLKYTQQPLSSCGFGVSKQS